MLYEERVAAAQLPELELVISSKPEHAGYRPFVMRSPAKTLPGPPGRKTRVAAAPSVLIAMATGLRTGVQGNRNDIIQVGRKKGWWHLGGNYREYPFIKVASESGSTCSFPFRKGYAVMPEREVSHSKITCLASRHPQFGIKEARECGRS